MSDNIKKIDLSTPGRILDAGDIRRKKDKLKKTKEQLKDLDPSSRKYHRKAFKVEKTEGQIESGRAGIGSFKMPYNAAAKQVVSSSGGDNRLDEFLKRVESRRIKNPEYADQEGPEYSNSYDFFITNRSPESDKVAVKMDSLNRVVMDQAKNKQFDEMRKTREYQQNLMNQYNLD
jgi:hypothetical protein